MKNLQVCTLYFAIIIKILYSKKYICITLRCADCMCNIEECTISQSPFEYPNRSLDKCCC